MAPAMRFSEAVALALHAMACLADDPLQSKSTKEMAAQLSGSEAHLSKVLQRLGKAQLIVSLRGPHGGFCLSRPASRITLLQIWEAIDGPVGDVHCMQLPPACDGRGCIFGTLLVDVGEYVRQFLASRTLADVRRDRQLRGAPGPSQALPLLNSYR
jgi:Rrf2 family protein